MESITIDIAVKNDLPQILALQKEAYISEAMIYNDFSIQPLQQSLNEIEQEFKNSMFLKAVIGKEIVGSVRAFEKDNLCYIGKLIVDKSIQNRGIGSQLLLEIETKFPNVKGYELFTGSKSDKNLYLCQKHGYKKLSYKQLSESLTVVTLKKKMHNKTLKTWADAHSDRVIAAV